MLNNSGYKLRHDKSLRVAYFGGSITEGAGASDASKYSYRAMTTAHLKAKYPDAEITEIYAAIGGTGTALGMFRVNRDVLEYDPDLVFVEFATNDFGDTAENVIPQTESIIRRIRATLPDCDVVFLFSTAQMVQEALDSGESFVSRDAQYKVTEYYGVPSIDFGSHLLEVIKREGKVYTDYAPDTLHPGDNGYAVVTEYILSNLDPMLDKAYNEATEIVPHTVPEKLSEKATDGADILYASNLCDLCLNGFEIVKEPHDRFPEYLKSEKGGSSFSFSFEGIGFGFYRAEGDSGCDFAVSIDGGEEIVVKSWDHYVRSFHRMAAAVVTKDLPCGKHTVNVRVVCDSDIRTVIGGIFAC